MHLTSVFHPSCLSFPFSVFFIFFCCSFIFLHYMHDMHVHGVIMKQSKVLFFSSTRRLVASQHSACVFNPACHAFQYVVDDLSLCYLRFIYGIYCSRGGVDYFLLYWFRLCFPSLVHAVTDTTKWQFSR